MRILNFCLQTVRKMSDLFLRHFLTCFIPLSLLSKKRIANVLSEVLIEVFFFAHLVFIKALHTHKSDCCRKWGCWGAGPVQAAE